MITASQRFSPKKGNTPQEVGRTVGSGVVRAVNARELHGFLSIGKVFAAWIQERIALYGFVENQDFVVVSDSGNNPKGGRPSRDYHITLDMAKELAMVERNEKGKQARQYFIECERRLLKSTPRSLNPYLKLSS
ncbi:antA/AntB antirepressor family protein [Nitrosospira sp. Nsp1]|uniref:antA/AntB antirepressor family protein n=1 Tax=Nitrosospira sp. Nsp1 TaxID=136547 RepID=UPI001C40B383